jgi:ParB-like nuclease domain
MSAPIPFHPLASLFPLMENAELDALIADIKKNGQREPIVLYQGKILDGRNRYRACLAAGVGLKLCKHEDNSPYIGDPVAYVISKNIHRRHLTGEQKRDLIAKLLKATPEKSDRQIAETVKASPTFVGKVRAEKEATGDVSTVDTRTDTRGRKQPARKPPREPRRTAQKKQAVISARQALVRALIILDRDLAVQLAEFFQAYPDQLDAFFADLVIFLDEANTDRDPDASAEAMKAKFAETDAAAVDDPVDPGPIPESLRRGVP